MLRCANKKQTVTTLILLEKLCTEKEKRRHAKDQVRTCGISERRFIQGDRPEAGAELAMTDREMRRSVRILTRRIRRSRGTARSSAITDQRFRHRDIDRRNCRSSEAENYPARKALETLKTGKSARGRRAQSTDALERADLNAADRPLEGVGAIERYHAPSVAASSRYQPSQSSPFERGGNFPGRKALKIRKTVKESRFDSTLSRLRFSSRNGHR